MCLSIRLVWCVASEGLSVQYKLIGGGHGYLLFFGNLAAIALAWGQKECGGAGDARGCALVGIA